jgi:hypothetical protein
VSNSGVEVSAADEHSGLGAPEDHALGALVHKTPDHLDEDAPGAVDQLSQSQLLELDVVDCDAVLFGPVTW